MTYEQAVELAKLHDDAGYHFLYENTYRDKYYIALKYMQNEQDALDVLQDSYLKAFNNLDSLYEAEKFPAWMGMIVANTAKNALAKKKPILFSEMNADSEDDRFFEYSIEDDNIENQPELAYTREETKELVHEMLQSLSEEQRLCILMFHIENMSIHEIANSLECSENTVKSRLNYGRKNLKVKAEELEGKGYKLYGLAPLPLLLRLLHAELAAYVPPAEVAGLFAPGQIGNAAGALNTVGNAETTGINSMNAVNTAGNAAKQTFMHTLAGKIVAGVIVIAVLAGVAVVISNSNKDDERNLTTQSDTGTAMDVTEESSETADEPTTQDSKTEETTEENTEYKQAYLQVLKENESEIKSYELDWGRYDDESGMQGQLPVAITDATGDDVPELIILRQTNEAQVDMEIYSLGEDKKAKKIFSNMWDVLAGSGQRSFLCGTKGSDSLYLYVQYGDVYDNRTFDELTMDNDGTLKADNVLGMNINYEENTSCFNANGETITEEEYLAKEKELVDNVTSLYLFNYISYDGLRSDDVKKEGMSYEEALEFLEGGKTEKEQAEVDDWKSAYTAVINDPVSWLQDRQNIDASLLDGASDYQYTVFDMNHDGTPELIIKAWVPDMTFYSWFFCTYNQSYGAYLIDNQAANLRQSLIIYNDNLAWYAYAAYRPECYITSVTLTGNEIKTDSIYEGTPESQPETSELEFYSINDTSGIDNN